MPYAENMRTTLDIDDELLLTVKQIAQQRNTTSGKVVSSLLRESLHPGNFRLEYHNGIPVLPRGANGPAVTVDLVKRLHEADE